MSSTFKELLKAAQLNPSLKAHLQKAEYPEDFIKIAAENDCDMTVEELKQSANSTRRINCLIICRWLLKENKAISQAVVDFLETAQSNPELKNRLKETDSPEIFADIASGYGVQLTVDEIKNTLGSVNGLDKLKTRWGLSAK